MLGVCLYFFFRGGAGRGQVVCVCVFCDVLQGDCHELEERTAVHVQSF